MKPCLGCLGEGVHDFREEEADIARCRPDIYEAMSLAGAILGVVRCERCGGSGQMSDEEHERVLAEGRAWLAERVEPIMRQAEIDKSENDKRRFL